MIKKLVALNGNHFMTEEGKQTEGLFKPQRIVSQDIIFLLNNKEIVKLCENGDIYVKGMLVENDKEVVEGFRIFLGGQGLYK